MKSDVRLGNENHLIRSAGHVCLIFEDRKEEEQAVAEYLAAGLRRGELSRFAADVSTAEEVRSWVSKADVEPSEYGQLSVFTANEFYCPSGRFNAKEVIGKMVPRWEAAKAAGHKGVRICSEMSWALRGVPGSEDFIDYEALINTVESPFPHSGMCMYDAHLFDGATLFKVLQVHPFVVAHGQIVSNPYYMQPEEFNPGLTSRD
jgi:hypothetical protein